MVVYKFGGALARSRRGLESLVRLTKEAHRKEAARARRTSRQSASAGLVVVVSAIGHTTRHLVRAAELAEHGELREAEETLERAVLQHEQLAEQLGIELDTEEKFDAVENDVRSLLEGIAIVRELSARTRDAVLAAGERLAAALITALLESRELPVRFIDAREIIITDERHGLAAPIAEEVAARVRHRVLPRLTRSEIVLTQGFIGATMDGVTTTMGSESSDLTATLLAGALGASEVVIWKTLPGLFTADPELVPNAKLIRSLTFAEAEEMGRGGARILFPSFAHPLLGEDCRTVLRISTPMGAASRHTVLQREFVTRSTKPAAQKAIALASRQKLLLVRITPRKNDVQTSDILKRRKQERVETLARTAFAAWQTHGERMILIAKEDRAKCLRELERAGWAVLSEQPVAAISLVIRKPKNQPAEARFITQISRSLRSFPTHAIMPIEQSIMAIVDDAESLAAMRKVHRDVFEG